MANQFPVVGKSVLMTISSFSQKGVHSRTLSHGIANWLRVLSSPVREWWDVSKLLGLLLELHNLAQRIRVQCQTNIDRLGLQMGRDLRLSKQGTSQVYIRTRARIQHTLKLFEVRLWSTLVDCDLFSAGWLAGAQWMLHSHDKRCCDECGASEPR